MKTIDLVLMIVLWAYILLRTGYDLYEYISKKNRQKKSEQSRILDRLEKLERKPLEIKKGDTVWSNPDYSSNWVKGVVIDSYYDYWGTVQVKIQLSNRVETKHIEGVSLKDPTKSNS